MLKPTVVPFENFDAEDDCKRLNEAMDGIGTNETEIIRILTRRSTEQRQELKAKYSAMYGEELVDVLKKELSGDFEEAILALMDLRAVHDARQLRKAMKGPGTNDEVLIEIICTRSNDKMAAIRLAYDKLYGRKLADDLRDDTSGDFKHLLVAMVQGQRDETWTHNEDEAKADAQAIFDAGEGRWNGTDEDEFTKILANRNANQLKLIFEEYEKITGGSFKGAVEKETSGNLHDAYIAIIDITVDHVSYYARKLHAAMRGIGTDEDALTRHIVGRSEIDLENIKEKYKELYGKELHEDIEDECSSDYKRLLLYVIKDFGVLFE